MLLTNNPNKTELEKGIKSFDENNVLSTNDEVLKKLFIKTYSSNKKFDEVIIKVATLDSLYNTQLSKYRAAVPVARHIVELNIDDRLKQGDLSLVNDIASVTLPNGKKYQPYSFASKYCSFHNPEVFPIYDSYVSKVICLYDKRDGFLTSRASNKIYSNYITSIKEFRKYYGLQDCSLKELDKYLWQLGSELRNSK